MARVSVVGTADDERTRDQGQTLKRDSGLFEYTRSRRIPVIEGLSNRRVPAALSHDIALVTASTTDSLGRRVEYNAEHSIMQIKIYKFFDIFVDDRRKRSEPFDWRPVTGVW
jgi:hypothetical protein